MGHRDRAIASAVRTRRAYSRARGGSIVDVVEPEIVKLLEQSPRMPASVVAERIGWDRGITVVRETVAELRPAYTCGPMPSH